MKREFSAIFIMPALLAALSSGPARAQTPPECLAKVKEMEPMMKDVITVAGQQIKSMIPDPAAYEKQIPPMSKVIATKDKLNLQNWGGLSEAYYFHGNKVRGEQIYKQFAANAPAILGNKDTFQARVAGDIGIIYFSEKNYAKATPYFLDATTKLENNLTAAVANNLVSDYWYLTIIRDSQKKKADAEGYAVKLVELVKKQKSQSL